MMQVETSVVIRRPVEAVFEFASDGRNWSQWQFGLGPMAPKDAARIGKQMNVLDAHRAAKPVGNPGESTLFEPDRELGFNQRLGPFEIDAVYHFEPREDGTTITWVCRVQAGPAYRFVESLVGQVAAAETHIGLLILKRLMERAPESGSESV